jgi:hypothetical protein
MSTSLNESVFELDYTLQIAVVGECDPYWHTAPVFEITFSTLGKTIRLEVRQFSPLGLQLLQAMGTRTWTVGLMRDLLDACWYVGSTSVCKIILQHPPRNRQIQFEGLGTV